MRIEQLALERYGAFTDRTLTFDPQAALHIVLGANEAGKTSALSAVGDLLFGFGARTPYDFRHDGPQLRIGGRFRHSSGKIVALRRRKGNKNTLIDENEQPLPDDLLSPLLGGLTRETFCNEFGLTAAQLREGGEELLRAGGHLAETLAASSTAMTALSRLRDRLQTEADERFTARRAGSKAFYLALDRRETADRALREAIITRDAIRQAEAAVNEASARLDRVREEHGNLGGKLALWQRALRTRSHLDRIDRIGEELAVHAGLPAISPHMLSDWDEALKEHLSLEKQIAAVDAEGAESAAEIAGFAIDERLLTAGADIDALRERLGAIRKGLDDLPRRRQARDTAQATLDDHARRLGLPSHVELLDRLPTDPALALARQLIAESRDIGRALAEADQRRTRAQQELDELAGSAAALPSTDIEQVRQRFNALGDLSGQAERLRREGAALNVESEGLRAELASLDPSPGKLENLTAVPLPDLNAIAKHAQAHETAANEARRLADEIDAIDGRIAAGEAELARLSSAGKRAARSDLADARRSRDSLFDGLRAALDGDREWRYRQFDEVRQTSQTIDSITDQLLSDTERATRLEDAQHRLDNHRDERVRSIAKLERLRAGLAQLEDAWAQLWAASGIAPREPAEMLRWRERIDSLLARLRKRDASQAELAALTESLEAGKKAVALFLESTDRSADLRLPADILFREAKIRFEEMQTLWVTARERAVAKYRLERDLAEAKAAHDNATEKETALRQRWPAAMAAIGVPSDATLAQAETALDVWREVPTAKAIFLREGRSAESIESDIAAFERDVGAVAERAGKPSDASAQQTLTLLHESLKQARLDNENVKLLQDQATKRATARRSLVARRDAVADTLSAVCRQIAVTDIGGLPDILDRIAARHRLEADQDGLRHDLAQIADGRDEATLRREREGLDLDLLQGKIDSETLRHNHLLKDIEQALLAHHQAERALAELSAGRNAPAAATERSDASAELLSIAEGWVLRATASRLATRAIERYRAKVQDPLVARAGVLFAAATNDAFAGLAVDYADNDQPMLVAQRRDGERVAVDGLSEGTRDQLFLALRLALLERWPSEPVPFIGDDLLTSFDEARTLSTLRLLASAGEQRQIILMTHHRHVAELAQSLPQPVDVIAL